MSKHLLVNSGKDFGFVSRIDPESPDWYARQAGQLFRLRHDGPYRYAMFKVDHVGDLGTPTKPHIFRTPSGAIDALKGTWRPHEAVNQRKLPPITNDPKTTHRRLTTKEAGDYVRVSRSALEGLRVKGGGPRFIKLGKKVLYDKAALATWIEDHKQASTADLPELRGKGRSGSS
jgi:predicted DNA-binding transcriptional regulator AlpA